MKRKQMRKYMVDTNIFNHLLDGGIDLSQFIGKAKFYITHVQVDELNKTPNDKRRVLLSQLLEEFTSDSIPTESFVTNTSRLDLSKIGGDSVIPTEAAIYGISKYRKAKYSSTDDLYQPIKDKLDKANKKKQNNIQDALIAETAIKNNLTLLTDDRLLSRVVTELGGACNNLQQVIKVLSNSE